MITSWQSTPFSISNKSKDAAYLCIYNCPWCVQHISWTPCNKPSTNYYNMNIRLVKEWTSPKTTLYCTKHQNRKWRFLPDCITIEALRTFKNSFLVVWDFRFLCKMTAALCFRTKTEYIRLALSPWITAKL